MGSPTANLLAGLQMLNQGIAAYKESNRRKEISNELNESSKAFDDIYNSKIEDQDKNELIVQQSQKAALRLAALGAPTNTINLLQQMMVPKTKPPTLSEKAMEKYESERLIRKRDPNYDPNSVESVTARKLLTDMGIKAPNTLTANAVEKYGNVIMRRQLMTPGQEFKEKEDPENDVKAFVTNKSATDLVDTLKTLEQLDIKLASMSKNDSTIAPNLLSYDPQKHDMPGSSIPGFGRISFLSSNARELNTTISGISNKLLNMRSGTAVTDTEYMRLLNEVGQGKFNNEKEMFNSFQNLKKRTQYLLSHQSGFLDDKAKQVYKERSGIDLNKLTGADISPKKSTNRRRKNLIKVK